MEGFEDLKFFPMRILQIKDCVRAIVHFGQPRDIIIVGGNAGELVSTDSETFKEYRVIDKLEGGGITSITKWNDDTLLVAYYHINSGPESIGRVRSYEISEDGSVRFQFEIRIVEGINRIMKLSSDLFMCTHIKHVSVWSYSKRSEVRGISNIFTFWTSLPLLSREYKNCFYINTKNGKKGVRLINYMHSRLIRYFVYKAVPFNSEKYDMGAYCDSNSIIIYQSRNNKEVLVCGGRDRIVCFFDTQTKAVLKLLSLKEADEQFDYFSSIFYLSSKNGQDYLFAGSRGGFLHLYDLSTDRKIGLYKVHGAKNKRDRTGGSTVFSLDLYSKSRGRIELLSCSSDGSARVTRIDGLDIYEDEDEDEKVRGSFLMDQVDNIFFERKRELTRTFILLGNVKLESICLIFLI